MAGQGQRGQARGRGRPFYGWAIVLSGALIVFSSSPGQSFIFSVFLDPILEDTPLTRTGVSTLYAVGTGLSAAMVMTVSRLADRFGARSTLLAAAIALGLACFGMAAAQGALAVFLAFSALRALGQGSMSIHATLLVAQWFVRRRGRAIAVMGLGIPVGVAVLPPTVHALIESIGWRETYVLLGIMVWVLVLPLGLLVVRERPEDVGLFPDGADGPPPGERPAGGAAPAGRAAPPAAPRVLTSLRFWLLAIPLATPGLVITALVFHQTAILEEGGLSSSVAASIFVPYAITSAVVSFLAGYTIERTGPKPVFIASMLTMLLAMGAGMALTSVPMAVLYAMLNGATTGLAQIVGGVTWAHFYGRAGLARVQGPAMTIGIAASALGPLPLAALENVLGGFQGAIAVLMVLPALAILTVLLAKPPGDPYAADEALASPDRPRRRKGASA